MGFAEIVLFIKSLPEMVKILGEIHATLTQMKQDSIDREIAKIKSDVGTQIEILKLSKSDDERKKALLELAKLMGK